MQVIISTRGLSISTTFKDAVTGRLEKLARLWPGIIEAKVVLSREKHRRTAALTLVAKHRTFRSQETAGDLAAALDLAIAALGRQVREMKDRVKNRKGRGARRRVAPVPVAAVPPAADVLVRQLPLKPMSLGEAMDLLQQGADDFLVFANATTDTLNVLYRRTDGGLGLIEPVA
jgi:putative sigma-54 modulation protein